MKKILLATSFLALSSGIAAAADINWSGYGRFGVVYAENYEAAGVDQVHIEQRFRLNLSVKTETTSGLQVEGRVRLQADDNRDNTAKGGGPTGADFRLSYGGSLVSMGFISDVVDSHEIVRWRGHYVGITAWVDPQFSWVGIDNNGFGNTNAVHLDNPQGMRVRHRFDSGLTVAASYTPDNAVTGEYYQVGAAYSFGDHRIGGIYGDNEIRGDYWVLGANGRFNDFQYNLMAAESEMMDKVGYGGSMQYQIAEKTAITGAFSTYGGGHASPNAGDTFGVGFVQDLGGGVSVRGSAGQFFMGGAMVDLGMFFAF